MARVPFKMGLAAKVSRPFVHAGTKYVKDAPFPYVELKLTPWDMWGLWLANLVDFVPDVVAAPVVAKQSEQRKDKPQKWQRR